jgi:single-stranded-DNA-specific exonuclease
MKDSKMIEAIAFFVDTDVWPNHRCETIRAAYRLDVNEYKGRSSVQLIIEYLEEA